MLDRMALSIRHQWFDEEGKVYIIFTVEQVIQYMDLMEEMELFQMNTALVKRNIRLEKIIAFCGNTFRNPENVFVGRSKKCGDRGNAWFGGT